jgi:hypothetical protein
VGPHDRLLTYFRLQRGRRFKLGQHDCLTFTNGAWRVIYGRGFADTIEGLYGSLSASETADLIRRHTGARNMIEALDGVLTRCDGHPPRGALIATDQIRRSIVPYALGIAFGTKAVFLGAKDVVYLPIERIRGAWIECHR